MFSQLSKSLSNGVRALILLQPLTAPLTQTFLIKKQFSITSTESAPSCSIHPSAIVHPGALICQDVSIGRFCTVGSNVKIGDGCQLYPGSRIFGDTEVGHRCVLMTGAVVREDLLGSTIIRSNNSIGHHAVVGARCQDLKYKAGYKCFLKVGDNNDGNLYPSIDPQIKVK